MFRWVRDTRFDGVAYPTFPSQCDASGRVVGCGEVQHAKRTFFNTHMYDSILEARFAVLFEQLGIRYKPHPRRFATSGGDWTIDFLLEGLAYVEIKPNEPYLEEEERCVQALHQTNLPVVILHGPIAPPYASESAKGGGYDRARSSGVRGIMFTRVDDFVVRSHVVFVERTAGVFRLEPISLPHVDYAWNTFEPKMRTKGRPMELCIVTERVSLLCTCSRLACATSCGTFRAFDPLEVQDKVAFTLMGLPGPIARCSRREGVRVNRRDALWLVRPDTEFPNRIPTYRVFSTAYGSPHTSAGTRTWRPHPRCRSGWSVS